MEGLSAFCGGKYPGGYSQCQSDASIYGTFVQFSRYGDVDNLSHERILSRKNQWWLGPRQKVPGAETLRRQSEIIGCVKEARLGCLKSRFGR
ncbi:hypothetical protein TNCV_1325701 [Trichonephila clavipes]|nr:hypothetical protein TNCV_1325701 [Trichonephila clavipes]